MSAAAESCAMPHMAMISGRQAERAGNRRDGRAPEMIRRILLCCSQSNTVERTASHFNESSGNGLAGASPIYHAHARFRPATLSGAVAALGRLRGDGGAGSRPNMVPIEMIKLNTFAGVPGQCLGQLARWTRAPVARACAGRVRRDRLPHLELTQSRS